MTVMNEKFCSQCGESLTPGTKFCPRCGKPIGQQNVNRPVNNPQPNWQNVNRPVNNNQAVWQNVDRPVNNHQAVWQPVNQNSYNNPSQPQRPVQNPIQQPPVYTPVQPNVSQHVTKAQYRKMCTNEKYLKDLKTSAIILYVLTGFSALVAVAGNTAGLLDAAIYLGLTLGMHLGKNKGCAIGILCYAIFSMVVLLAVNGTAGGWLWLIGSIGAVKCFSIADKEYEARYGA